MSMHTIIRYEAWSDERGDHEAEHEITFRFTRKGVELCLIGTERSLTKPSI